MVFSKRLKKIWNAAASLTAGGLKNTPLSFRQAMDFFDQQAARDDLAFGYPHEACFARNHLMCEAAIENGYKPKKAWAHDDEGKPTLVFKMPDGTKLRYWVHTATVLPVKPPAGAAADLVFDPALLDGPVPLREWGDVLNVRYQFLEIKPLGKPPTNYPGDYDTSLRTTKALSDLTNSRHPLQTIKYYQQFEVIPRVVFASRYCREVIFPALGEWPERRGNGWISEDPFPQPPSAKGRSGTPDGTSGGPAPAG